MRNGARVVLFFILYKAAESQIPALNYDITKPLADSIVKIFQSASSTSIEELFTKIFTVNSDNLEVKLFKPLLYKPFYNEPRFYLRRMELYSGKAYPKLHFNFSNNQVNLFSPVIRDTNYSIEIGVFPNETLFRYDYNCEFDNVLITAVKVSNEIYGDNVLLDFSYGEIIGNLEEREFPKYMRNLLERDFLKRGIQAVLTSVLRNVVTHYNLELCKYLMGSHLNYPKRDIISEYPNFLVDEPRYYYFIANISTPRVTLFNTTIKGLSNFETLKVNESCAKLTITNITGFTDFYDATTTPKLFRIDFKTDGISMWVDEDIKEVSFCRKSNNTAKLPSINVQVQNFRVSQTRPVRPFTNDALKLIVDTIENGIKSTIVA